MYALSVRLQRIFGKPTALARIACWQVCGLDFSETENGLHHISIEIYHIVSELCKVISCCSVQSAFAELVLFCQ